MDVRPDAAMAYHACENASRDTVPEGNVGAGMGCTIGKYRGISRAMKSGLGTYAVQAGRIKVGAIVAVNALGDVYDIDNGQMIAGCAHRTERASAPRKRRSSAILPIPAACSAGIQIPPLEPFSRMEPSIRAS